MLRSHPRVDPQRIILMGVSRGGQAALYASVKRFHQMWNKSGIEFAGYIAFYPDCAMTWAQKGLQRGDLNALAARTSRLRLTRGRIDPGCGLEQRIAEARSRQVDGLVRSIKPFDHPAPLMHGQLGPASREGCPPSDRVSAEPFKASLTRNVPPAL